MEKKAEAQEITGKAVCVEENEFKGNELREYANMLSERAEKVLAVSGGTDSQRRYVLIDKRGGAKTLGQEIQKFFGGKGGGSPQMIQGTMSGNFEEIKGWFEQHA